MNLQVSVQAEPQLLLMLGGSGAGKGGFLKDGLLISLLGFGVWGLGLGVWGLGFGV